MESDASVCLNASNNENVYVLLEDIFESCIAEADSSDLISNLGTIYDSFSGNGFEASFDQILLYVFTETKRSSDANKILHFIAESAVSLDNKYKTAAKKAGNVEDIDNIVHPFMKRLFRTLHRWSQASNFRVRFRSCHLISMILTYIQDHGMGEIDMEAYENVSSLIESRRLDVSSIVRSHAVHLARFFQDPSSVNDPVITGLCWQMQYDPNPRVRQNIVSIIAACEETVMPIAKLFLYDKNPSVRNAALVHICQRVGPRSFTPTQRVLILQQCFSDSSDVIRRNAEQKLIPVWFRASGDKLCNFFKLIRIGNESLENLPFVKELTKILSRFVKVSQIIEELELDNDNCLPKSPLSGEKVFLWRQFFLYSIKDERLSKFFPSLDILISYILKCFDDSSSSEVEICVFNELILFLMDIMESFGIQKCDEVFPTALNLMRHPFVSHEIMPYLVTLYLTFSPKDKEYVHSDILGAIEDLQKLMALTQGHELNILQKCITIASQVLRNESSLTTSMKSLKDNLIIQHLNSEDPEVKSLAVSALTLYCLLDIKEAKLSWEFFENALTLESSSLKNVLLKGAFDILKCHGIKLFSDLTDNGQEKFDAILQASLECLDEEGGIEQDIILKGILKLYVEHHTLSPTLLANIMMLYFHPNDYKSVQHELEKFFFIFGKSKNGYICITEAFLKCIELLFEANKNSFLYKINIKSVALKLLEITEVLENRGKFSKEKFQDLFVLKLTKKFIKKPWRLTASELFSVCSPIIPEKFETLLTLKEHVLQILESLQSSVFQQKNPFSKKNIKSFSSYQKKIQTTLNNLPLTEPSSTQKKQSAISRQLAFDSSSSSLLTDNSLKERDIEVDISPVRKSFEDCSPSNESYLNNDKTPPTVSRDTSVINQSVSKSQSSQNSSMAVINQSASKSRPLKNTPMTVSNQSASKSQSFRNTSNAALSLTPEISRKIATPLRRSSRKTPAVNMLEDSPVFKTPGPRKTPRKRNLDVTVQKI